MTFPTPNGSTNLGDPITDTGERRRMEDAALSTSARYDRRVVELAVAQEQLRRLRERVEAIRKVRAPGGGWDAFWKAFEELFAELDIQNGDAK